ncbi:hypothetical protein HP436_00710 [Pseudomonas sp. CrR14]|nr:hypothetical protein [Pseudomonas sp. CrR14]
MIPVSFKKFMEFVLNQTRYRNLNWISGEGGSYIAQHQEMSLYISTSYDENRDRNCFWFRLIDPNGSSTPFSVYDYEEDYDIMRILFEEVISNANKAEESLDYFMKGF